MVTLETSLGNIVVRLFEADAPETVRNFLEYVRSGHYDGTIFHRVINGFMVQGGGFDEDFEEKGTRAPVLNEAYNGLSNKRGTLAMARTMQVDSATAQFFINLVDNTFLDHKDKSPRNFGYCVFGEVVEGMEVVDAIREVETAARPPHDDVPVENVVILKAYVSEDVPDTDTAQVDISAMDNTDTQRCEILPEFEGKG